MEDKIDHICIGTADRPESLGRLLESLINHLNLHKRNPCIIVADDSKERLNEEKNCLSVGGWQTKYTGEIRFLTRKDRVEKAKELSDKTGVLEEVINFGLVGDKESGRSTFGAVRNMLMLEANGKKLAVFDDDLICETFAPVNSAEGGVFDSNNPLNYCFLGDSGSPEQHGFIKKDLDILSLHEKVLGKTVGEVVKDAPIGTEGTKIAITSMGLTGDSTMESHLPLIMNPRAMEQLFFDGGLGKYEHFKNSSRLIQSPASITFHDGIACFITMAGLDTSLSLPPFITVQRSSDGLFGFVLNKTHVIYSAYLPQIITHDRPLREKRIPKFDAEQVFGHTNRVLSWLVLFSDVSIEADPKANMKNLGAYLKEKAGLPESDFKRYVENLHKNVREDISLSIQNALDENKDFPDAWRKDVLKAQESLRRENFPILRDISSDPTAGFQTFQRWLRLYSELLLGWQECLWIDNK